MCWVNSLAQELYMKFPITAEGMYAISMDDLRQHGFNNISEVGIFGQHGPLNQVLTEDFKEPHQLPSQVIGNRLVFYAQGPHRVEASANTLHIQSNPYTDTLFYWVGRTTQPQRISSAAQANASLPVINQLAFIQFRKWQEDNILNSGRNWYSRPFFGGQTFNFSMPLSSKMGNTHELFIHYLGQAVAENRFHISVAGQNFETFPIPPIPNTTYGIKGIEGLYQRMVTYSGNELQVRTRYESSDFNGAGFLDFAILSSQVSVANLSNAVYLHRGNLARLTPDGNRLFWKINSNFEVHSISEDAEVKPLDKIASYQENQIPLIRNFQPVNLSSRTAHQNASLLIITHPLLQNQANRLANHKISKGIQTAVVLIQDVFDGYAYGNRDVTGIRNFIADKYQNGGNLKNVLFLGKGTYDYKGIFRGRPNLVPIYTSRNSLNPLMTYSSDDYFGMIAFGIGFWEESPAGDAPMQIGVGRIPAINAREAREAVDKIINYENVDQALGPWKSQLAFVADDGDNNIHITDSENHIRYLEQNHPEFSIQKIYLDRFEQIEDASNRQRSPEAQEAFRKSIENGVLFLNFIGHGNENTLTAEEIFTVSQLNDWRRHPHLPLIITATCEFGRHDSPLLRSAAEEMIFAEGKGALGLLTTGRPVFSSINFRLNSAFIQAVFKQDEGEWRDLGTIFKLTKNNSLNGSLNRNFSLLGDPSLTLALPDLRTSTERIVDINLNSEISKISGGQLIAIEGIIEDPLTGAQLTHQKGEFNLQILDRPKEFTTLGDENPTITLQERTNALFQGKGLIVDGKFRSEVFIPTHMEESLAKGQIRIFATLENGMEAFGSDAITLEGSMRNSSDTEGPQILLKFGLEEDPTLRSFETAFIPLLIELEDESGINVLFTNPAKNIVLDINGERQEILNASFQALNNQFQKGTVRTALRGLRDGTNTVKVEAWDNVGNQSIIQTTIEIKNTNVLKIIDLVNYPNPTITHSRFKIVQNRPGENLILILRVYSLMGQEIITEQRRYIGAEFVIDDLEWKFFQTETKFPAKGTYIYNLQLISERDGSSDTRSGKILIK
nr:type IX secretion system sortase PorU [Mongoliitalea daihaiensis]